MPQNAPRHKYPEHKASKVMGINQSSLIPILVNMPSRKVSSTKGANGSCPMINDGIIAAPSSLSARVGAWEIKVPGNEVESMVKDGTKQSEVEGREPVVHLLLGGSVMAVDVEEWPEERVRR